MYSVRDESSSNRKGNQMRKILVNAKSITPKKVWKKGFAVVHLQTALDCKRPCFKFIDKEREGDLKAIFASFIAQGLAYAIIYRKARLTGDDWKATNGIMGSIPAINEEAFPTLTSKERTSRIRIALRHMYSIAPLHQVKEVEKVPGFFKFIESLMKREVSKKQLKKLEKMGITSEAALAS